MKEHKLDEKQLKLEGELVGVQGLTHKDLNRHESFMKTQTKRQQRFVKQSVLVGEPSSDIFQRNVRRKALKCRKKQHGGFLRHVFARFVAIPR